MKYRTLQKIIVPCFILGGLLLSDINAGAAGILLKKGMQGEEVRQVQLKLKELGYFNATATGYYGEMTKQAVEKYQRDRNFTVDGIVGPATWSALIGTQPVSNTVKQSGYTRILQLGMRGEDVKQAQEKLKELGYLNAVPTGYYGTLTVNAVKNFQRANGKTVDGIIGQSTWDALMNNSGTASVVTTSANTSYNRLLKEGMKGEDVKQVQIRLKELGYFNGNPTGYYGTITKQAVMDYQRARGCVVDGIVGQATWTQLFDNGAVTRELVSRGSTQRETSLIPWSTVKDIFKIGTIATVVDIGTGIRFQVKRTFGTNHADVETLTADDTYKMKQAYGGSWSWDRRPIIVIVNGMEIAASMNGMPHAGLDNAPALQYVSDRSGGYGYGQNLDVIKGNGMDGQFCIHFLGSRTHGSNSVDPQHQAAVKKAAQYIDNR